MSTYIDNSGLTQLFDQMMMLVDRINNEAGWSDEGYQFTDFQMFDHELFNRFCSSKTAEE